jgi:uncharacterized protein (DUF736 family)
MPAIGTVTRLEDGSFNGQLKTLSIKADITIQPNDRKTNDVQPDYGVLRRGRDRRRLDAPF